MALSQMSRTGDAVKAMEEALAFDVGDITTFNQLTVLRKKLQDEAEQKESKRQENKKEKNQKKRKARQTDAQRKKEANTKGYMMGEIMF